MIFCLWKTTDYERDSSQASIAAEEKLRGFEKQAWNTYLEIAETLNLQDTTGTTDEFLATRIMPVFVKIGLDETFIRILFRIASKAWKTFSTSSETVIPLRSNIQQDIDDVRKGLLLQADRKMATLPESTCLTPRENYDRLREYMDPANLQLLIDEITTSWIILPRAYGLLKRDHINYLTAYLEVINSETNEQVLHVFTRIVIEFLANYTIRFADDRYSRKQVAQLVIAGYATFFWRNLNTPPRGFEDIRIFEHFLVWLKRSGCRKMISNHDMKATIQEMEACRAAIFPSSTIFINSNWESHDISGFIVALRHGCIGIDCTVRYFWLAPTNIQWPRGWTVRWSVIVFSLKSLFELIAGRYDEESKRSRYYIGEFLFQLKNIYAYSALHNTTLDDNNRADLKRLRFRIMTMTERLQHTLSDFTP